VGIYIGGGQFVHAPHTGDVVKISSLTGYYSSAFIGGRRI
jgi:cell wall-associated NlpC family hydrolase